MFQAFISYKHDAGLQLADRLARALRRYAKPALSFPDRIFRDEDHLVPHSDLPNLIRRALADSKFLILLASPAAAQSSWVADEVRYWCEDLQRADNIILVLTAGTIALDPDHSSIDWSRTSALPGLLEQHLRSVPLYVDLRWVASETDIDLANAQFKRAVNAIAARMRGIDPNEMLGAEVRQTRRNMRLRNGAVAAILALLAVSAVATVDARNQRDTAVSLAASESVARSDAETAQKAERAARVAAQASEKKAKASADDALLAKAKTEQAEKAVENERDALRVALQRERVARASADSRRLAIQSGLARVQLRLDDLNLAISAIQMSPTREARENLRRTLLRPRASIILRHSMVSAAVFADAGDSVIIADQQRTYRLRVSDGATLSSAQVAFSRILPLDPDGSTLLGSTPDTLWFWNGQRDTPPWIVFHAEKRLLDFTVAGGEILVLTQENDGAVHVVSTKASDPSVTVLDWPVQNELYHISWNEDGTQFAAVFDRTLSLWETRTGKVLKSWRTDGNSLGKVTFAPDGRIAIGDADGRVRIWREGEPSPSLAYDVRGAGIASLTFNQNGGVLAVGSDDGSVRVWNGYAVPAWMGHVNNERVLDGFQQAIWAIAFSPKSDKIVAAGMDGVAVYPTAPESESVLHGVDAMGAAFDSASARLVTRSAAGSASIWDLARRRRVRVWEPDGGFVIGVGFVNGRALAVVQDRSGTEDAPTTRDDALTVQDLDNDAPVARLSGAGSHSLLNAAVLSPDGRKVAASVRGGVLVWSVPGGSIKQLSPTRATALAFSPDGRLVAFGNNDENAHEHPGGKALYLDVNSYDLASGRTAHLKGLQGIVTAIAFSDDGRRVVAGNELGAVRSWDARTGAPLMTAAPINVAVLRSIKFEPGGARIVAAGDDGIVRLLDSRSGNELEILQDNKAVGRRDRSDGTIRDLLGNRKFEFSAYFADFDREGRRVVTASADGHVRSHFRKAVPARSAAPIARNSRARDGHGAAL